MGAGEQWRRMWTNTVLVVHPTVWCVILVLPDRLSSVSRKGNDDLLLAYAIHGVERVPVCENRGVARAEWARP